MGGRGGNSTRGHGIPKKTAADCKNLKELTDYMWNTHRIYMAKSMDHVDFETARNGADAIEQLMAEFPALKTPTGVHDSPMIAELNGKQTVTGSFAAADFDGSIKLNPRYMGDKANLDKRYALDVKSGYHPKGTTGDDVIVHEMGHIMERALIIKDRSLRWPNDAIAWNKGTKATAIIGEACKLLKKTPQGKGLTNNQLVSRVSRYATQNRSEALAECVADYYRNRSNADPLSIQVWNILKRELK